MTKAVKSKNTVVLPAQCPDLRYIRNRESNYIVPT